MADAIVSFLVSIIHGEFHSNGISKKIFQVTHIIHECSRKAGISLERIECGGIHV